MPITARTSPANQSGNASSVVVSRDASVQADDVRWVFIFTSSGVTLPTPPTGWTVRMDQSIAPDTTRRFYALSHVHAAGDPATYTFTFSAATNYGLGQAVFGGATEAPHEVSTPTRNTGDDGTGANQTTPDRTASVAGCVLLVFFGQAASGSTSAVISLPSAMTNLGNSVGNGTQGSSTRTAYETRASTGATGTRAATCPATGRWAAASVLIAPAPIPGEFLPFF